MIKVLPSSTFQGVVELLAKYNLDGARLLQEVGLPLRVANDPFLYVDRDRHIQFFRRAIKLTGERFFLLNLAEHQGFDFLNLNWRKIAQARTLLELTMVLQEDLEHHCEATLIQVKRQDDGFYIRYNLRWNLLNPCGPNGPDYQHVEYGLAHFCKMIRHFLGAQWKPRYTQLMHQAPQDLEPLRKVFGKQLYFNQEHNSIFLTQQEMETRLPPGWVVSWAGDWVGNFIDNLETPDDGSIGVAIKVDHAIRSLIFQGACRLDDVASHMGITARTLQRKLKTEGSSFQNLLDRVRLELSLQYLEFSNLTIAEIAERMQFSETSVFSRFIKANTNQSPSHWR